MISESMIVGVLLLVLFGAASLYLYSYVAYVEKKVGMIESLVVDMRMAMDSMMTEDSMHPAAAAPISSGGGIASPPFEMAGAGAGVPAAAAAGPAEESFYSSVLEQAHEGASAGSAEPPQPGVGLEAALEGFKEVESVALEGNAPAAAAASAPAPGPNYDAMTRAELTTLAEQRGLRVKKSMSRGEILSLLRRSEPTQIQGQGTGTENVSGPTGADLPSSGSIDGGAPVESGLGDGAEEVAL